MAKSTRKTSKTSSKRQSQTKMGMSAEAFEQAVAEVPQGPFTLTLYISGLTSRSQRAIDNIQKLCEEHMAGRYDLKIIDIYQQPGAAKNAQIVAVPTLIKQLPPPLRRVIGDMGDLGRVMVALEIAPGPLDKT